MTQCRTPDREILIFEVEALAGKKSRTICEVIKGHKSYTIGLSCGMQVMYTSR